MKLDHTPTFEHKYPTYGDWIEQCGHHSQCKADPAPIPGWEFCCRNCPRYHQAENWDEHDDPYIHPEKSAKEDAA